MDYLPDMELKYAWPVMLHEPYMLIPSLNIYTDEPMVTVNQAWD